MNRAIVIQARMSSSRLPGKMMMDFAGMPLYEYVCRRCLAAADINAVILATSDDASDDPLAGDAAKKGYTVFRGPLHNVLARYVACALQYKVETVIRICGDSPFVDLDALGKLLDVFHSEDLDYACLVNEHCIKGMDSEMVRTAALERALRESAAPDDLEHVTPYLKKNSGLFRTMKVDVDMMPFADTVSLTVDTPQDFDFCRSLALKLVDERGRPRFDFNAAELIRILNPHIGC